MILLEYAHAKENVQAIRKQVRQLLVLQLRQFEYGKAREGYWALEGFMAQLKGAVKVEDVKYSEADVWRVDCILTTAVAML